MTASSDFTVGTLTDRLADRFPLDWAEPWDAVGLRIGDRRARTGRVCVTLDADVRSLEAACGEGCGTLVTHHPPFLGHPGSLTGDTPEGRFILAAAGRGIAVVSMHTNLDRSPEGADALPLLLGLSPEHPLEESSVEVDVVTVFVPAAARAGVVAAIAAAGGGRIGLYEACSFTSSGEGRFTARAGARSATGRSGSSAEPEDRLEMVVPAGAAEAAVAAARAAHPYEEPVILVTRATLSRGVARLGRVCSVTETRLGALATHVAELLCVRPRIWGDADRRVTRVAVANGSGSSLVGAAIASEAQALIVGEVRYHDAMAALNSGLALIEAGHDATEWPIVDVLAAECRAILGDAAVLRAPTRMAWWTGERA
ncbi:MAG TPA: Nif3-like dinuclear metal center hexameric protein [Coriobacteriia bacterium]|nr:Nif3-like dinuclear metal center hexameric protein [Coriobacteriia bacterium]